MNENFDNFTQEPNNTDPVNDFEESYSGSEVYAEQRIELNDYKETPPKSGNKGLKIFCVLLVVILIISGGTVAGYFLGKRSVAEDQKGKYSSQELLDKPTDADDGAGAFVYSDVAESVVTVHVYNVDGNEAIVSGMIYSEDGYIVTTDSIYTSVTAAKFKVFTADGKEYSAEFVGGDSRTDISVIKIKEEVKLVPIKLGNSDQTVAGENVYGIGHPNGLGEKPLISEGIVSASYIRIQNPLTSYSIKMIQTTVNANSGDYGGPLINSYGQVIGMLSLSKTMVYDYNGYQYPIEFDDSVCAVPSVTLKSVVEAIIENGKVPDRARIGISYVVKNSVDVELEKLPAAGLMIANVDEKSELFGKVHETDIITEINGTKTLTDNIVLDLLDSMKPGDTVTFKVIGVEGKESEYSVKLLNYESESSYSLLPNEGDNNINGGLLPY